MKYIVFWVLAKLVSVPCSEPTPNEYGINGFTAYLGGCQKIERDTLQKEFDNRAAAEAFIEGSKKHSQWATSSSIEKIWLDSMSAEPETRGVTFRIAAGNVTIGRYMTPSPQDIPPNPFSMRDSIASLQKQVAELRAVVEKITQNPFYFQGQSVIRLPVGQSLGAFQAECPHSQSAQIGINHFCLSCGERLTIKPGESPNKNEHGKQ